MKLHISIILACLSLHCIGQDLSRRASWEARLSALGTSPGALVTSIDAESPLKKVGIIENDIILQVNGKSIQSDEDLTSITYALRADGETELLVRRGNSITIKTVNFEPLGMEKHKNLDIYYEQITSDYGNRQRVIITKPKNDARVQPAIVLIQGLSCSTIENYPGRRGNWAKQINHIVEQSGVIVMRVEKPGVGDSEGDCAKTDFITELEGYRSAIRHLKSKTYVDTTRIVVYGASMGSALAPLLANEFDLAGVISDGTFFKTWFEHMLEIERRIRRMSGDDQTTIVKKMNEAYIPLYYGMLIEKKSYKDIINSYPAIAEYNYHPEEHMYGRPMAYYQQLQNFDLAGEWEKLTVPVRILYGSNDWIMSEFDNHMIIQVLDRVGHKDHELTIYPGLDHWNTIHKSSSDSFLGRPGEWDPNVPELIVKWAKEMVE